MHWKTNNENRQGIIGMGSPQNGSTLDSFAKLGRQPVIQKALMSLAVAIGMRLLQRTAALRTSSARRFLSSYVTTSGCSQPGKSSRSAASGAMTGVLKGLRIVQLGSNSTLVLRRSKMQCANAAAMAAISVAIRDRIGLHDKPAMGIAGEVNRATPGRFGVAPSVRYRIGDAEHTDVAAFQRPNRNTETKPVLRRYCDSENLCAGRGGAEHCTVLCGAARRLARHDQQRYQRSRSGLDYCVTGLGGSARNAPWKSCTRTGVCFCQTVPFNALAASPYCPSLIIFQV